MIIPDWAGYLRFRDAFAAVMDARYYTPEWLDGELLSGAVTFMRTDAAAIIVELRNYPTGAIDVHGIVAAGDLADVVGVLIPRAEQWARELGCIGAVIESREGWSRALKASGYNVHQVAVRKEL
jgi:hypothetical protein